MGKDETNRVQNHALFADQRKADLTPVQDSSNELPLGNR